MRGSNGSVRAMIATALALIALALVLPTVSWGQTPTPTPGPCCSAHAGPRCDVPVCSDCVCGADPLCCVGSWDTTCATTDTILHCPDECQCSTTPAPTPTPGGPCCSPRDPEVGGTGCDIVNCQACVCGRDADCCNRVWDATCVSEASVECAADCGCAPPATETPAPTPTPGGDCCTAHEGASCDDTACRTCICNLDAPCCNSVWDQTCTDETRNECALQCACPTTGDCCAEHDGVGCDDSTCKSCVCGIDASCCGAMDGHWDADCVSEANVECAASCICEVAGTCCEAHDTTVGCDDRRCQECVCTLDESCCSEGWDGTCADEAANECHERCTGCGVSDCCGPRTEPGCSADACKTCVCNLDGPCCTGVWDQQCADEATNNCAPQCQCQGGTPCSADCDGSGTVGISELVTCVNIALGGVPLSTCTACDPDNSGTVGISELILAVNAALTTCP